MWLLSQIICFGAVNILDGLEYKNNQAEGGISAHRTVLTIPGQLKPLIEQETLSTSLNFLWYFKVIWQYT